MLIVQGLLSFKSTGHNKLASWGQGFLFNSNFYTEINRQLFDRLPKSQNQCPIVCALALNFREDEVGECNVDRWGRRQYSDFIGEIN